MATRNFELEMTSGRERQIAQYSAVFDQAAEKLLKKEPGAFHVFSDKALCAEFANSEASQLVSYFCERNNGIDATVLQEQATTLLSVALTHAVRNIKTENTVVARCRWVGMLGHMIRSLSETAADMRQPTYP